MLGWRLTSAALFLAPLISLIILDYQFSGASPGIWLVPIAVGFCVAAAWELNSLYPAEFRPTGYIVPAGTGLIVLASAAPMLWSLTGGVYPVDCPLGKLGWPLGATALAVTVVFLVEMRRFEPHGDHVIRISLSTFTLVYIGLFLSFLYPLRTFGGNELGMVALLSAVLIVKTSDAGAYAAGKLVGRRPLAPRLSPAKTIEGAVGGLLTAAAVSWLFFTQFAALLVSDGLVTEAWRSVTYGLVLAVAAMIGDLSESLIKRDMQRKDSSSWLPGLGGILDLLDSVIIATPTAYLCWSTGLIGPGK